MRVVYAECMKNFEKQSVKTHCIKCAIYATVYVWKFNKRAQKKKVCIPSERRNWKKKYLCYISLLNCSIHRYPCEFGGVAEGRPVVNKLDMFGQRVINNLWNALLTHYPEEVVVAFYSSQFKGELQLSMFYVLYENYQHFLLKWHDYLEANCLRKSKLLWNPSNSWVIDQNVQNMVLINNSRTAWHTKILMTFLSFSDNLL